MIFSLRGNKFFLIKSPSVIPSKVKTSLFLKKKLHSRSSRNRCVPKLEKGREEPFSSWNTLFKDCWKNDCFLKKSGSLYVERLAAWNSIFTKFTVILTGQKKGTKNWKNSTKVNNLKNGKSDCENKPKNEIFSQEWSANRFLGRKKLMAFIYKREKCSWLSFMLHKKKFSIKHFFSKCDQIHRKLRICSHLLEVLNWELRFLCSVNPLWNTLWNVLKTPIIVFFCLMECLMLFSLLFNLLHLCNIAR